MNKQQKAVIQYQLDSEKEVLEKLTKQYERALWDIDIKIRVLQSDELTQSKIYRIEYQKALKKQVEAVLEKLHADEYTTIQQFLSDSYTTGYVGTAYDMFGQGVPLILPIDKNAAVKAVVTDSKISEGLYEALGVDTKKLKTTISSEITRGIASGLPNSDIARNIAAYAKAPLGRAKTIVRTESHRIQQAAALDAQKTAISKGANVVKQWNSTLDGKTRPSHRKLDGLIQEVDEPFEMDGKKAMYPGDFGDPAEDCNCRCQLLQRARIALNQSELKALRERAVRHSLYADDPAAYRAEKLPALRNFEEFRKNYLEASKMATELATDNDWSKTMARTISKEKKKELLQYAESKNIILPDLKYFDGDPDLLIAEIDALDKIQNELPIGKKVILSVGQIKDDGEFGNTLDWHITLNSKIFRDRSITENNIILGGQFASTTLEDIVLHEYGHIINNVKGNKSLDFARKAYYNVYGDSIPDEELVYFLQEHVSIYAIRISKNKKFKELVPEILAMNNSHPSEFTTEFVELLKGWLSNEEI